MRARQWKQGFLIGVLLLAACWLAYLIFGLFGKAQIAIREAREAEWQYRALEERKTMIEDNLAALESARGEDAAIRTTFGVARKGEEVIVVVPPDAPTTTPPLSWWQKVLNWF